METRVNDLAAKITDFCRDHDFYEYMDNVGLSGDDRDKQIDEVVDMLKNNKIDDIKKYLKGFETDDESVKKEIRKITREINKFKKDYYDLNNVREGNLDKYEILGDGEHGGLSTSKIAMDKTNNEKVFIKIVSKAQMSALSTCLKSEAQILNKLDKVDGVAKEVDFFQDQDNFYLVEKMIEGKTLKDSLPTLNENEKQNIFKKVLSTIKEIHNKGFVHRDLKPNNILIDTKGNAHVIDFNISMKIGETVDLISGNRKFSPPEQLEFDNVVNPKNDVYTLGKIYEFIFEKSNELSEMATKLDIDERCSLDDLITGFEKEMTIVEPVKEDKKLSIHDMITEAKAKAEELNKNISVPEVSKKKALEI